MELEYLRNSFGSIIKSARVKKGISQYALADAAGVGRRYIQRLENGYQEAKISTLFGIAKALEISPMTLIGQLEYSIDNGELPESVRESLIAKKIGRPKKELPE